jgi:hypothetical protein
MTQKQKELLLKDLCSRLPYEVKCKYYDCSIGDFGEGTILGFERRDRFEIDGVCIRVDDVRPYLFPLSSMTEEQKKEFDQLIELELKAINDEIDHIQATAFEVDFYNKHHFDWRGLIPLDLANDATNLNIY